MQKNNKWYSVLVSILIIGFLMVLTVGTFNLVLRELNDSKWAFDYLKAYNWAEAAWELALLTIKEKGYWYYKKIDNTINDDSIILSNNPTDKTKFNKSKDVLISYDLNYKVKQYNWNLKWWWWIDIIPLFYIDKTWEHKLNNLKLNVLTWDQSKLTWNILSNSWGISWVWNFDSWNPTSKWKWRFLIGWNYEVLDKQIGTFLVNSNSSLDNYNYLILMNIDPINNIKYSLSSVDFFTLPRTHIITTWQIWKYKQNLDIFLDNTEYLWRSRYSIYSN